MPDERTNVLPSSKPLQFQPTDSQIMLQQSKLDTRALQSIANSLKFFVWVTIILFGIGLAIGAALVIVEAHNTSAADNRVIVSSSQS
jgi:hypothetical protein